MTGSVIYRRLERRLHRAFRNMSPTELEGLFHGTERLNVTIEFSERLNDTLKFWFPKIATKQQGRFVFHTREEPIDERYGIPWEEGAGHTAIGKHRKRRVYRNLPSRRQIEIVLREAKPLPSGEGRVFQEEGQPDFATWKVGKNLDEDTLETEITLHFETHIPLLPLLRA